MLLRGIKLPYIKIIFGLCMIILLSSIVLSIENSTGTYIGTPLYSEGLLYDNMKIDDSTLSLQDYNANDRQQLSTEEQINEYLKENLMTQANDGWGYVVGYLFILKEIFILLFFLIEMKFIIWFLVDLIPNIFIKLRDAIANFYKLRSDK
jgi:hypothetical protein